MNSIYKMKLHDTISLTPNSIVGVAVPCYSVMRVPGGWIYHVGDTAKQDYVRETFVPFDNEFMGKETTDEEVQTVCGKCMYYVMCNADSRDKEKCVLYRQK